MHTHSSKVAKEEDYMSEPVGGTLPWSSYFCKTEQSSLDTAEQTGHSMP